MLKTIFLLFAFTILSAPAFSQENPYELPNGMFKPEFVMGHLQDIGATDKQRQGIMQNMKELQSNLSRLPEGSKKIQFIVSRVGRINSLLTNEQKKKLKALENAPRTPTLFGNPQRVTIEGYSDNSTMEPFISRDGQYLFFNNSNERPGTNTHVLYAKKVNDTTFELVRPVQGLDAGLIVPKLNSLVPSMDSNGNFYFSTTKSYEKDFKVIYQGVFKDGEVTGIAPVEGISLKQRGWFTMDGEISADGNTLYYSDNKSGDTSHSTMKIASKNADGSFTPLANSDDLLKTINDGNYNYAPATTKDGLELFFTRDLGGGIYVAKRSTTSEPFGPPELAISTAEGPVEAPSISDDGTYLYYVRKDRSDPDPHSRTIYVATRNTQ